MMRIFWLYLFSLVTIFCCSSSRALKSNLADGETCKLYPQEFSVDISTYKQFSETLSDFFNSENRFDALFIKMKGGDHSASEMRRWVITNESGYKVIWSRGENKSDLQGIDAEKVLQLANSIEKGDFLQVCPYSTSNDSFLILIKVNSVVKFKYSSTEKDYQALPPTDQNKIANVISLLTYLNSAQE